jgi:hypothetical protein
MADPSPPPPSTSESIKDIGDDSTTASSSAVSELQQIYQIISDRSEGRATNEDVEAAVSRLLTKQENGTTSNAAALKHPPPTALSVARAAHTEEDPIINEDMEDYDIDETETLASSSSTTPQTQQQVSARKRKRNTSSENNDDNQVVAEPDWSLYSDIPLGKQGAKMMTTFGDARSGPDPAAVAATLLGARKMLQTILHDARHVRRHYRKVYRHAKETLRHDAPQKPVLQEEWTTELLYKALKGYDPQATAPPCGFGLPELRQLCPEEMNAYARWNALHDAAVVDTEKKEAEMVAVAAAAAVASKAAKEDEDDDEDVDDDDAEEGDRIVDMALTEGHLQERAEQFDLRTDRMEKGWYLKFSNIRCVVVVLLFSLSVMLWCSI